MARWNRLIWAACSVRLNERKRLLLRFVPVMDIAPIQSAGSAGSGSWVWSNLSTTYAINGSPTDRKKELIGSLVLEPSRRRHIFYEKNAPLANRIGGIARVRTGRDGTDMAGRFQIWEPAAWINDSTKVFQPIQWVIQVWNTRTKECAVLFSFTSKGGSQFLLFLCTRTAAGDCISIGE